MILAPTSGSIGMQPHGSQVRMINKSAAALAIGQVVTNSYAHTGFVYPATTVAESNLTPLACCTIALGTGGKSGYLGVVVDLQSGAGAVGTEVIVQFGGVCKAKVTATAAVAFGSLLGIHDSTGVFTTGGSTTSTLPAAVALDVLASGTSLIHVMVTPVIWFEAAI